MYFYEKDNISIYLNNLEVLENLITQKQSIQIFKHSNLGMILVINGEIQHIQNYQCLYHELLVHLPASFIEDPKTALIIGGGSLFAAYELLKYPSITNVTLCDHDEKVLQLMAKYYTHASSVIENKKFNFIEKDALEYLSKCSNTYDLIINDCFNLLNLQHNKLNIYLKLKNLLTKEGLCSDIIYRHIFDGEITKSSIYEIKKISRIVLSLVTVPEYPGVLHLETIWGNNKNLSQSCTQVINNYQKQILSSNKDVFDYFSPKNLPFYLYLPPYIKRIIT